MTPAACRAAGDLRVRLQGIRMRPSSSPAQPVRSPRPHVNRDCPAFLLVQLQSCQRAVPRMPSDRSACIHDVGIRSGGRDDGDKTHFVLTAPDHRTLMSLTPISKPVEGTTRAQWTIPWAFRRRCMQQSAGSSSTATAVWRFIGM